MEKVKAAIYCRISPFADEFTLTYLCGVQKAVLLEKAEASNFEVVGCYADIGYTGDDMKRPNLLRMLQDYKAGKFSIVLVCNRDRLVKGACEEIPVWPFPVLSAGPSSDMERESEKIARYMRSDRTSDKTKAQQRRAVRRTARKNGYR